MSDYIRTKEASEYSGLSKYMIRNLRKTEDGPKYFEQNGHYYYSRKDLDDWIREKKRQISVRHDPR